MYFEVKTLIMTDLSDFPFMEINYFNSIEGAENEYFRAIKNDDVVYTTIEKITKSKKKTIRSYQK